MEYLLWERWGPKGQNNSLLNCSNAMRGRGSGLGEGEGEVEVERRNVLMRVESC